MRYRFYLQKSVYVHRPSKLPKYRLIKKIAILKAKNYAEAKAMIDAAYPEWEVSMYWPEWPQLKE